MTISKGFEDCGQWPLRYEKAIERSTGYRQLTLVQADLMRAAIGPVVELYRQKGFVTEEEMDALHVPVCPNNDKRDTPKDLRVLHQQRAVLMSGTACIEQYKARKENAALAITNRADRVAAKLVANEAKAVAAEEKRIAKDIAQKDKEAADEAKRIATEAKKTERAALQQLRRNINDEKNKEKEARKQESTQKKKRQRDDKEIEQARIAALTPEEKKAERAAKRARVAVNATPSDAVDAVPALAVPIPLQINAQRERRAPSRLRN
jgi:hypothetical protein